MYCTAHYFLWHTTFYRMYPPPAYDIIHDMIYVLHDTLLSTVCTPTSPVPPPESRYDIAYATRPALYPPPRVHQPVDITSCNMRCHYLTYPTSQKITSWVIT